MSLLSVPADNVLIPASEISQYTGIAKQTHNRWRHENVGPQYVKLGHRVFYRSDDVRAWIDSNCQISTGQIDQAAIVPSKQCSNRLEIGQFKQ